MSRFDIICERESDPEKQVVATVSANGLTNALAEYLSLPDYNKVMTILSSAGVLRKMSGKNFEIYESDIINTWRKKDEQHQLSVRVSAF